MTAKTKSPPQPSSGTAGFFQEQPALCSIFDEDEAYQRVFNFYLPSYIQHSITPDLRHMSNLVISPRLLTWSADAERNTPYLTTWNSWGKRIDTLVTSEGWRELQALGIREGIVALGHEGTHGRYDRVYQFLKYHIWTAMSADVTCPSAMTDGAARLLRLQMEKGGLGAEEGRVFERAWERLVSRDPAIAWTSGQWMTERSGGSDVQGMETVAMWDPAGDGVKGVDVDGNPLGPYSITGFKWFSSATDANSTVLLAKESPSGAISAFFAPTRLLSPTSFPNSQPELNGISIQRLKPKLGTRALPTAELILTNLRAHRIGASGQGTKEISTILNITRVHNAVSAVSAWGRGLAISRAFSRVRRARGMLLMDLPAHVHTLAAQQVDYTAMMHLTFYTVALLGCSEHHQSATTSSSPLIPTTAAPHLLRLLTPITKAITAKAAIAGLQECIESLGGVGYLENEDVSMNIARLYRGANVLSIWEGTTNVMADDLIRVVKGSTASEALDALEGVVKAAVEHWRSSQRGEWAESVSESWREVRQRIVRGRRDDLALDGRGLMKDLSWIVCAVLLGEDALSDGNPTANEICARWNAQRSQSKELSARSSAEAARWDRQIVFGDAIVGTLKL